METITMNISGRHFEISPETLRLLSQSMSIRTKSASIFVQGRTEYFIERHADVFQNVLYYVQTGQLHMPQCVCPNLFLMELEFWGVDVCELEKCCYNKYGLFRDNREKLKSFENYFKPRGTSTKNPTSKWGKIRKSGWKLLNDPHSSLVASIYFWLSMSLVAFNVTLVCLATHPFLIDNVPIKNFPRWLQDYMLRHYFQEYSDTAAQLNMTLRQMIIDQGVSVIFSYPFIFLLQLACFGIFSVELFFKIIFCPSVKTFFTSPLHVLDVLAVLPFHCWLLIDAIAPYGSYIAQAQTILEGIAIIRVFRLLRLARRIRGLRILLFAMRSSLQDILLLILVLLIAAVIFASLMYYVDNRSVFPSIPGGMWWSVVTMTTVGYGDVVPVTWAGKILGAFCAISGVLIVALTVPVFASKFQLFYTHTEKPEQKDDGINHRFRWVRKTKIVPFEK